MLIYLLFGFLFYRFGEIFDNKSFLIIGHGFIAMGSAWFFGLNGKWIEEHCPRRNCSSCRLWTCRRYGRRK